METDRRILKLDECAREYLKRSHILVRIHIAAHKDTPGWVRGIKVSVLDAESGSLSLFEYECHMDGDEIDRESRIVHAQAWPWKLSSDMYGVWERWAAICPPWLEASELIVATVNYNVNNVLPLLAFEHLVRAAEYIPTTLRRNKPASAAWNATSEKRLHAFIAKHRRNISNAASIISFLS